MENEKQYKGNWLLPSSTNEVYPGTLYYNRNEGCYIEIFGAFEGFMASNKKHDIILGTVLEGKLITLVNCSRSNYRYNTNDVTVAKYTATFALIGQHFNSIDDIKFDTLHASITDLSKFIGIYGIDRYSLGYDDFTIELEYKKPRQLNFKVLEELQVFFDFTVSAPSYKHVDKFEIDQKAYIGLKFSEPAKFYSILNRLFTLYKFLCIAYYDSPPILELFLSNSKDEVSDRFKVELVYSDFFFNRIYKVGKEEHEFLFTYQNIVEEFPSVISLWFSLFDKISPAVNLLTILLLKKEYPLELKFLSAVQAVETFHRNMYGGIELQENLHRERVHAILNAVPEEYKEWLGQKLNYANELNLRKRLRDVYNRLPKEISSSLVKNKSSFIASVVNARNYFTHYSHELKNAVVRNDKLFAATEKLKVFLVALILCELNFTKEKIGELMPVHKVFPFIDPED